MDKVKLVEAIRARLQDDLVALKAAALATYEAATHEESKPENEYDTFGLEASYLAGAQAKRAAETEELLTILKHLEVKNFSKDAVASSTALLEVAHNGKQSFIFLLPKGGGLTLDFEGHSVQIVTPNSPLGEAVLGLQAGDAALVEIGEEEREYEIISLV